MQLYLKLSGKRNDEYLQKTYTNSMNDTNKPNPHMLWLQLYISEHYANEIHMVKRHADGTEADHGNGTLDGSEMQSRRAGPSGQFGAPPSPGDLRRRASTLGSSTVGDLDLTRFAGWDVPRAHFAPHGRRRVTTSADVVTNVSPTSSRASSPRASASPRPTSVMQQAASPARSDGTDRPSAAAPPTSLAYDPESDGTTPPSPGRVQVSEESNALLAMAEQQQFLLEQLQLASSMVPSKPAEMSTRDSRAAMIARARAGGGGAGRKGDVAVKRNMYL